MVETNGFKSNDPILVYDDQPNLYPATKTLSQYSFPITNAHINIDDAWAMTMGNRSIENKVKVGIYDTGINWRHDDFSEDGSNTWDFSRVKGGYDYFNKVMNLFQQDTSDYSGHGTKVAGVIGAIRNNEIGIAGIAGGDAQDSQNPWGVDLYSMKIFDNITNPQVTALGPLTQTVEAIVEGATDLGNNPPVGSRSFGLDVMNFSWQANNNTTGATGLEPLEDAVIYAFRNNVSIAVSAGNDQSTKANIPASYRDDLVMKVGGSGVSGERYSNGAGQGSNYGSGLDFLAPGHAWILMQSLVNDNNSTYASFGYTSGACPHVAGIASLMIDYIRSQSSAAPNALAPEDIEHLIEKNANNRGVYTASKGVYDPGYGWGLVDAGEALKSIQLPKYEVKHYIKDIYYSNANLFASNATINVGTNINTNTNIHAPANIPAGVYTGDVYQMKEDFNITQSATRGILDVWNLNSISTLHGIEDYPGPNNFLIESAPNCIVLPGFTQTKATMEGYIYHITSPIDVWLPAAATNLTGMGKMALTAYTSSPFINGINEQKKKESFLTITPNPSNGIFTIQLPIEETASCIEITDAVGKVVYKQTLTRSQSSATKDYLIDVSFLQAGVYFCTVSGPNSKALFAKLIITK